MTRKPSRKISKKASHLVVGAGEVGGALFNVLQRHYPTTMRDKADDVRGKFDVMHVAYPPFKNFVEVTKKYAKQYQPKVIVVHSTVPVGTTRKVGANAVHSPIRGVHPRLEKGIKTFVKYFGGTKAKVAAAHFEAIGIPTHCFKKPETTELAKILDTTYYGWNIIFAKETKRICDKFGLNFDEVYTIPNQHYNEGYRKHGMHHVRRPVLKHVPGPIGGHCVIPNTKLLDEWVTKVLKTRNKTYFS